MGCAPRLSLHRIYYKTVVCVVVIQITPPPSLPFLFQPLLVDNKLWCYGLVLTSLHTSQNRNDLKISKRC